MPTSRTRQKRKTGAGKGGRPKRVRLVTIEDPLCREVSQNFKAVFARAEPTVGPVIVRHLPSTHAGGGILDPEESTAYLHNIRVSLETEADVVAQTYSPMRWLWYTRRAGWSVFAGRLITTELSTFLLLETLTGLSKKTTESRIEGDIAGRVVYDSGETALEPLARMAVIAIALTQVHSWLRRAGKGTSFRVHTSDWPEAMRDQALEAAIKTFDQRVADGLGGNWHPTMSPLEFTGEPSAYPMLTASLLASGRGEVFGWQGKLRDGQLVKVDGLFVPEMMTLEALLEALATAKGTGGIWWDSALPSLIVLLQSLAFAAAQVDEGSGVGVPLVGYTVRTHTSVLELLELCLPQLRLPLDSLFPGSLPSTPSEVYEVLLSQRGNLWPHVRGPILREEASDIAIDVAASSALLHELITIPKSTGGALVNVPARSFELEAQRVIDDSLWKPPPTLIDLRGVTLRRHGGDLTDIDALGSRSDVLLVASCKNVTFSRDYDAGIFSTVRNVRTTIEDAVIHWDKVVQDLRANPVGDNYDFSSFRTIVGVVVTPRAMFVSAPNALRWVAHRLSGARLRATADLGELREFVLAP